MILGADNQNKNLRIASTIKISPTAKTRTANHYSAAVSSSKSGKSEQTIVHESARKSNDGRPDPIRGSLEGLDNGKSTYIQMSNRGYDSKFLQTARYSDKTKQLPTVKGASFLFTNQQNKGIINNYTKNTSYGTSSHRMNKGLNLNRYF